MTQDCFYLHCYWNHASIITNYICHLLPGAFIALPLFAVMPNVAMCAALVASIARQTCMCSPVPVPAGKYNLSRVLSEPSIIVFIHRYPRFSQHIHTSPVSTSEICSIRMLSTCWSPHVCRTQQQFSSHGIQDCKQYCTGWLATLGVHRFHASEQVGCQFVMHLRCTAAKWESRR